MKHNFHRIKILPSQLPLYCRKLVEKIFANVVNAGCHILYAIFNTGQIISMIKLLLIRAGGETGKNFLLAKISMHTVPKQT